MRALFILIGSMIFTQLHAQYIPATDETAGKTNTIWRTFKTSEQIPAQQLAQSKSLLQLGNDDDLMLFSTDTDQLGYTHYRYQQTYKGIPIEGAIYLMHEKSGRVKHANGKLARQLQLTSIPSISVDAALPHALAHTKAEVYAWDAPTYESSLKQICKNTDATFYPLGQLVIINPEVREETAAYRLAYKFDIYAVEPLSRQVVYIDAHTGEVLTTLEKIHHCTGEPASGATHYSDEVDFTACQSGSTYTLESDLGGGIQTFDGNNTYSYPQIPFTDSDGFFEGDLAAVEVQWATETAYHYFQDVHSRNSLDGNGMPLHSWVHYRTEYNNAFWNGSWMTYGDGDNERFSSLTAPDVVGHEMMHGITDFSADLMYSYESGALNESFSDIFGEVIEAACNPDNENDWIIGGDFTVWSGKNGLRSLSNPNDQTMLTQQPDTYQGDYWYSGSGDNGGVHYNSGVQNYWFYLLSEGGSGINDNGYAYDVEAIGMEKAAAIAYRNLSVYLTSGSQYEDARIGAILAAENLYGENSDEVAQVVEAWCAVGVGECAVNCQEDDYIALRALYLSADGDNWTDNTGWLTEVEFIANPAMPVGTDVGAWYGVTTNSDGCVTCIDLDGVNDCSNNLSGTNNLVGNIPPEIGNLTHLTELYLDGNELSGGLPSEIGNLINLTSLYIRSNQFDGNLPPEIGNLSNLTHLYLVSNQFTGNIPPEIGNLSNLLFLIAYENNFTGSIPLEVGNLNNVEVLNFSGSNLTGNIPPEIGNMDNLEGLDLSDNNLIGSIPPELGDLANLSILFLDNNELSGCYSQNLATLCDRLSPGFTNVSDGNNFDAPWEDFCDTQAGICLPPNCQEDDYIALRALYLSTDGDNWYSADSTSAWPNAAFFAANPTMPTGTDVGTWYGVTTNVEGCVTCIDMDGVDDCDRDVVFSYGNNLIGSLPPELGSLSNLANLYLEDNQLTGTIPLELANLSNLITLNLGYNQLDGSIPSELANLNNLASLGLHANQLVGTIPPELANLINLTNLTLADNQLIGNIPPELGNLSNLTWFNLADNQLIGNIPPELGNLSNLANLFLYSNQLTGCYPANLMTLCGQLTSSSNSNERISNGNSFDAPWEDFCATQAGICPPPACLEDDYIALRALYLSTDGDNWGGWINGWFTEAEFIANPTIPIGTDVGTWSGVTTDANGCVTELSMISSTQIEGVIPPEIGNLNHLTILSLRYADLSGGIPPEIGNLGNLIELNFQNSELDGNIPPELGNLSNLRRLNLRGNNLSGSIPPELGNLDNLHELWLSENQLSGNIPPDLGALNNLGRLFLSNNQLSNNIPTELGDLSSLTWLSLYNNQLTGNIPSEIGNLNNLDTLFLYDNSLSGCYPMNLTALCGRLDPLFGNNVTISDGNNFDAPWENFCATQAGICPPATCLEDDYIALRALYLSTDGDNWANNTGWLTEAEFIANPTMPVDTDVGTWYGVTTNVQGCVIYLILHENQLSGSIPVEIGNLSNLISLWLYENQLSGSIPAEIGNLSNLLALHLLDNQLSSGISPELGNLSNLTALLLYDNQLSGEIPQELGKLSNLNFLLLAGNQLSGSIPEELGNLSNLTNLWLYDNQLSGCYKSNLLNLCIQLNNSNISDGNNFDAPWEDFCATQAGICTNFTDVYPGDFNNDGTANIQDLLYWGIAEGYEGVVRDDATTYWAAQPCDDWTVSAYNINSKHQDGDGDGIVNNSDLLALIENYDSTHSFAPSGLESPLQFVFEPVDVLIENDILTMTYEMFVESSLGSPVNVHGLAFGLDFGGFPIDSVSVDFDNSVLIPEETMDVYNPSENKLDVALTRIDKVNQTCDAALLTARVVTEDLDFLEPFEFQVNGGQLMTTGGIDDTDGALSIISSSTLTSVVSPSGLFVSVNATPVRCNIGGTAEISYINGTAPYTYIWSTGENTASVSGLNIGTHQVTVTDADGLQAVLDFDIEWTFTSIRARTDSGKICIDLENAPLTEAIGISIDNGNTYMSPVTTNVCYDVPEGDYQVWAQQADLQCPVYLDSLHVLIDDIVIIDSTPSTIELFNTLGSESQIECNLNRSGDMHVYLYNTHGQLIRTIQAVHTQAGEHQINVDKNDLPAGLYYIHVQFTTKNHPLINKILKLPVMK